MNAARRELPKNLPRGFRSIEVRAAKQNEGETLFPIVISSDAPVKRQGFWGWFYEVLPHDPDSINMQRAHIGLPVLVNHDPNQRAGITPASIDSGKLRGAIRFGTTDFARSIRQEVEDETLTGCSVGYGVDEYERIADIDPKDDEDPDYLGTYRATRWEPYEVSLTPIEADIKSGVGRSQDQVQQYPVRFKGAPENPSTGNGENERNTTMAAEVLTQDALMAERKRSAGIAALQSAYPEIVTREVSEKWLNDGIELGECRGFVLDKQREKELAMRATGGVKLNDNERKKYDFMRVVRSMAGSEFGFSEEAGFEREISQELAKKLNRDTQGILVPTDQPIFRLTAAEMEKRALVTSSSGAGGATVATELISFIDALRPIVHLFQMGAKFMGGMSSNFSLPKMLTDSDFNWVGENPGADNGDIDPTFTQVNFSPLEAIASTAWSRKLLVQSSVDVEARVRSGLLARAAIGIEKAALQGAGGTQPTGLLSTTGVNLVSIGANGGQPTKAHLTSMDTDIQIANAALGEFQYLMTPEIGGYLENTPELNNTIALPIWTNGADGVGRVRGKKAYRSNLLPKTLTKGTSAGNCHAIVGGVWPELTIAEFGAMEILVDPYTKMKQALINIAAHLMVDSNVTYAQAFTTILDAIPA